jgi:hypothetical protein
MERSEIISAIEKLKQHSEHQGWCEEFVVAMKKDTAEDEARRNQLNADFQRAFLNLFYVFIPDKKLPKHQRDFLRPNRRSVQIWLCMVFVLALQWLLFTKGAQALGVAKAGEISLAILILAELLWVVWFVSEVQPEEGLTELGMNPCCLTCDYDLNGLESVLGDRLWVGPAVCPECGQDYPAIPE